LSNLKAKNKPVAAISLYDKKPWRRCHGFYYKHDKCNVDD
jgi:hypothetical protein